jgi:hypothetical protein
VDPQQVLNADDPVVQQVLELLAAGDIGNEDLQTLPKHVLKQLMKLSKGTEGAPAEDDSNGAASAAATAAAAEAEAAAEEEEEAKQRKVSAAAAGSSKPTKAEMRKGKKGKGKKSGRSSSRSLRGNVESPQLPDNLW